MGGVGSEEGLSPWAASPEGLEALGLDGEYDGDPDLLIFLVARFLYVHSFSYPIDFAEKYVWLFTFLKITPIFAKTLSMMEY